MGPGGVVARDPAAQAGLGTGGVGAQIISSCATGAPRKHYPCSLPSMLIRTPAASSTPVNGKLATLVAVEDLRPTVNGQGFLERLDAEGPVHGIGQAP